MFHCMSREDLLQPLFLTSGHLHHEVVTVNEQSEVPFHMYKQCRIAEAMDETVLLQDLRVMRLPTSTRIHRDSCRECRIFTNLCELDIFLQCMKSLTTFSQSVSRCWIITPWSLNERIHFFRLRCSFSFATNRSEFDSFSFSF